MVGNQYLLEKKEETGQFFSFRKVQSEQSNFLKVNEAAVSV